MKEGKKAKESHTTEDKLELSSALAVTLSLSLAPQNEIKALDQSLIRAPRPRQRPSMPPRTHPLPCMALQLHRRRSRHNARRTDSEPPSQQRQPQRPLLLTPSGGLLLGPLLLLLRGFSREKGAGGRKGGGVAQVKSGWSQFASATWGV